METLDNHAEAAVHKGIEWMRAHDKDICLLGTVEQFGAEYTPHDRLPELEDAARQLGMHIVYADAAAKTVMGEEPLYYVLLSRNEVVSEDEIKDLLPGFHPVLHWHEGQYRAAA